MALSFELEKLADVHTEVSSIGHKCQLNIIVH